MIKRRRFLLLGFALVPLLAGLLFVFGLVHAGGPTNSSLNSETTLSAAATTWRTKSVTFADNNWNCWDAACATRVGAGAAQPNYQCAEFVARSYARVGFMPGLGIHTDQSKYLSYNPPKLGNKKYDLLLITPLTGYLTLADYLRDSGHATNINQDLNKAEKGDMVIFQDKNSAGKEVAQHTVIIVKVGNNTSTTLIDAHNNAHHRVALSYEISGFDHWYILHIHP